MINDRWCTNSTKLTQLCSPHLDYLTVKCRPSFLPRELASVIMICVYIPPEAYANTTIAQLSNYVSSVISSRFTPGHSSQLVVVATADVGNRVKTLSCPCEFLFDLLSIKCQKHTHQIRIWSLIGGNLSRRTILSQNKWLKIAPPPSPLPPPQVRSTFRRP